MKSSLLLKRKIIPEYVIVSIALLQSEIFWICSVVYHVLVTRLTNQASAALNDENTRHRAGSAPPVLVSNPVEKKKKNVTYSKSILESDKKDVSKRRASLGDLETMPTIRVRPSVHDERTGTTCPPIWWQKTRVKLRRPTAHTRVASDVRPKLSTSGCSSSNSSIETLKNGSSLKNSSKGSDAIMLETTITTTNAEIADKNPTSSILRPTKSLTSLHTMFTSSRNNLSTYTINEQTNAPLVHLHKSLSDNPQQQQEQQQRRNIKKFISKLNTSLRPRHPKKATIPVH